MSTPQADVAGSETTSAIKHLYAFGIVEFESTSNLVAPVALSSAHYGSAQHEACKLVNDATSSISSSLQRSCRGKYRQVHKLGELLLATADIEHVPLKVEAGALRTTGGGTPDAWTRLLPDLDDTRRRSILHSCHQDVHTAREGISGLFQEALYDCFGMSSLVPSEALDNVRGSDAAVPFGSPDLFDVDVEVSLQVAKEMQEKSGKPKGCLCLHWNVKWTTENGPVDLLDGKSSLTFRQLDLGKSPLLKTGSISPNTTCHSAPPNTATGSHWPSITYAADATYDSTCAADDGTILRPSTAALHDAPGANQYISLPATSMQSESTWLWHDGTEGAHSGQGSDARFG
jgi:hypothetical protein